MNRRDALRRATVASFAPWAVAASAEASVVAPTALPESPLRRPAPASRLAATSAMLDLAAAGPRLVAVGERGRILLSDDGGKAWRQARAVPVSVTLTAVAFVGERLGWATGHSGVVLHTADAGDTWQLQFDGERAAAAAARQAATVPQDAALGRRAQQLVADGADKPFLDVDFTSATKGIVVGAYGLIFSTEDGGGTWLPRMADTDNPKGLHLNAVRSVGPTIYIAGERGLMLRSDDASRFTKLAPLYDGSWFALGASAQQGVTVAGLRGTAFHCPGEGAPGQGASESWQRVAAGDQTIAAVSVIRGHTLLVSQGGSVRQLGPNGGDTRVLELRRAPAPMTALVLASDGALVAATLRGPARLADAFPG